jgi:hypothetical protein
MTELMSKLLIDKVGSINIYPAKLTTILNSITLTPILITAWWIVSPVNIFLTTAETSSKHILLKDAASNVPKILIKVY